MGKNSKQQSATPAPWYTVLAQAMEPAAAQAITEEWLAHVYAAAGGGAKAEHAINFADQIMVARAARMVALQTPREAVPPAGDALDNLAGNGGDGATAQTPDQAG